MLNSIVTFKLQRDPKHGVNMGSVVYNKLRHNIAPDRKGRMADHLYRALRTAFHRTARNSLEKLPRQNRTDAALRHHPRRAGAECGEPCRAFTGA